MASSKQQDALKAALYRLDWTQKEFAYRVGVHENTVSKWMVGKAKVPGPVEAYLSLAVKVKTLSDSLLPLGEWE